MDLFNWSELTHNVGSLVVLGLGLMVLLIMKSTLSVVGQVFGMASALLRWFGSSEEQQTAWGTRLKKLAWMTLGISLACEAVLMLNHLNPQLAERWQINSWPSYVSGAIFTAFSLLGVGTTFDKSRRAAVSASLFLVRRAAYTAPALAVTGYRHPEIVQASISPLSWFSGIDSEWLMLGLSVIGLVQIFRIVLKSNSVATNEQDLGVEETTIEFEESEFSQSAPSTISKDGWVSGKVIGSLHCADGDSGKGEFQELGNQEFRMDLIDTPETAQPTGPRAAKFTRTVTNGGKYTTHFRMKPNGEYGGKRRPTIFTLQPETKIDLSSAREVLPRPKTGWADRTGSTTLEQLVNRIPDINAADCYDDVDTKRLNLGAVLVALGLAQVYRMNLPEPVLYDGETASPMTPQVEKLLRLQEAAKNNGFGRWGTGEDDAWVFRSKTIHRGQGKYKKPTVARVRSRRAA